MIVHCLHHGVTLCGLRWPEQAPAGELWLSLADWPRFDQIVKEQDRTDHGQQCTPCNLAVERINGSG